MAVDDQKTTTCAQCGKTFPSTVRICPDDGTVLEHAQQPSELGKVLDGKYRLDAFLSHGGMGAVYRATHVMLGKTVAVKLIKPELVTSPEVVRRFQREARAATALNHPNIVAVFDLGQTADGMLYIAMEFVDGPTLKSVITGGGPMAAGRVVGLARQIVSALSVAHRNKIVHRDLKPQNIMLARGDAGQEIAKLVDFGIAKTFDDATQLTMAGDAIGTPHYMAPEQSAGQAVDARSDLYSVGIILYEMLTGSVPFDDASAPAILVKHLQEEPERPSLKNPHAAIPEDLEAIVLKCLAKDPANRFQTADELGAALDVAAAVIPRAAPATATIHAQQTKPMTASAAAAPTAAVPAAPPAATAAPSESPTRTADTRPTVASAEHQGVVAQASAPKPASSSKSLPVVAVLLLAAVAAGAFYYVKRGGEAAGSTSQTSQAAGGAAVSGAPDVPPPTASPAMAAQSTSAPGASALPAPSAPPSPASAVSPAAQEAPAAAIDRSAPTGRAPAAAGSSRSDNGPSSGGARIPAASGASSSAAGGAGVNGGAPLPAGAGAAVPSPVSRPSQASEPVRQAASVSFPANPSVYFQCVGVPEICSPLRTAVDAALEKGGLTSMRNASRADVSVTATATVLQEQASRQFGTAFNVRNYSIDVSGEAPRTSEAVPMPPATTLSFDQQFGSERATERSRVLASDIVDKVKAFAMRKQ